MLARSHEAMNEQPHSRELIPAERADIRTLVEKHCANYDRAAKECLPLECSCYMLGKWWTGAYCQYFLNSVLPLDPALEVAITGRAASETKPCAHCGKPFYRRANKAYCSAACADEADRKRRREYMRKYRG